MAGRKTGADEKPAVLAVVRVRGPVNVRKDIEDTLEIMRLGRINHCVLVPNDPSHRGMLHKAEECITWGEVGQETLEKLIFKRGEVEGRQVERAKAAEMAKRIMEDKKVPDDVKMRPVFRLSPPSKGYKAISKSYPRGTLGYRGEKINELLKRMI
jgi:large subunit ribosomal protein L30